MHFLKRSKIFLKIYKICLHDELLYWTVWVDISQRKGTEMNRK